MNRVSWTRPSGPQAPLRPTHPSVRDRRRAALRALALCCTAALPLQALAQATCTPPPAVPANLVQPGTAFTQLRAWMTQNGIAFVGGDSSTIIPCSKRKYQEQGCRPMTAAVMAEQHSNCFTAAMAGDGNLYILGLVRRYSGWRPANLGLGMSNPSDTVYLMVKSGQSLAVYHDARGMVRNAPEAAMGWRFRWHNDSSFVQPSAQWRPDQSESQGLVAMYEPHVRGGPSAFLPDDGDGFQQGIPEYAWITCAAGCCQFHGSGTGGGGGGGGDPRPNPDPRPRPFPGNQPKPERK
ncbi:MAG TPA: hypothetical protein VFS20_25315 [Longimicrobium sp.]|nr:hypothetical protein [Longimicrobium sp.]